MTRTLDPTPDTLREAALEALVDGLRNAHALEKQAVATLEAQLDRTEDHPDLHARIRSHLLESREQGRRLEGALDACGASSSVAKDLMMRVLGFGQASVQSFADDAVLKAVLADIMFERMEIASYRSLVELADMAGKPELRPRLEETLHEEEAMAEWLEENLPAITRRHVEISAGELEAAKNPPKGARNPAEDQAEGAPGSAVAAVQEETRAREARAHGSPAPTATADAPSGGSLGATPANPTARRAASDGPDAVREARDERGAKAR